MTSTPLAERVRERLLALLADDRPDPETLLARLTEVRRHDGVPAFSAALKLLVGLETAEAEAEGVLLEILRHRAELARALERDPGLRVAAVDFLSNLDHRIFGSAMEREVRRSHRYQLSFSLLLLHLGRSVPDEVAGVVRRSIREADLGCRFAADEFAVILAETGRSGALVVAERLRRRMQETFPRLTLSGGISCYPDDGLTPETLVRQAQHSRATGEL